MTVLEVICGAFRLVGKDDLADTAEAGGTLTDIQLREKRAFLAYYNAVLDELARGYFPLDAQDTLTSKGGRFSLSDLSNGVIRIRRVEKGGKPIPFRVVKDYVLAEAESADIFYEYAPPAAAEEDSFSYPVYAVGERLVQYGMVAEYYLVLGSSSESEKWEEKYRNEIEALLARCSLKGRIPPRRWI